MLTGLGCTVDAWETTYLQVLSGPDPVFQSISGTGPGRCSNRCPIRSVQSLSGSTRGGWRRRTRARIWGRCAVPPGLRGRPAADLMAGVRRCTTYRCPAAPGTSRPPESSTVGCSASRRRRSHRRSRPVVACGSADRDARCTSASRMGFVPPARPTPPSWSRTSTLADRLAQSRYPVTWDDAFPATAVSTPPTAAATGSRS